MYEQKLKTKRLLLRPWKKDDGYAAYENFLSDKKAHKLVSWNELTNLSEAEEKIFKWTNEKEKMNFAIIINDTNEIIGNIFMVSYDEENKNCELGYFIGSKYWNNGYATEALKAVIVFIFEQTNYNKIYCIHIQSNVQSQKVIKKAGLIKEKIKTNSKYNEYLNEFENEIVYSIKK